MKYFIIILLLFPIIIFSQRPDTPEITFDSRLDGLDEDDAHVGFTPQFVTESPLLGNCSEIHVVGFEYPRTHVLKEVIGYIDTPTLLPDVEIRFTPGRGISNCSPTNEPYLASGTYCQINLPTSFMDRVINNERLGPHQFFGSDYVPNRRFKLKMIFERHDPVERTYEVIVPTQSGDPILIHDWANCVIIQNEIFVRGAVAGSINDNCFAICNEDNHSCNSITLTSTQAFSESVSESGTLGYGIVSFGVEFQHSDETGAEISVTLPEVTISAGPGEFCVPLFDIKVDRIESNAFSYDPVNCSNTFLGLDTLIRPVPGARNVQWQQGSKYCAPFQCEKLQELGRPKGEYILELLPDELQYNIKFEIGDPVMRGAIDLQWDDLDTDNPFFVQNVSPGTYCYTITSPCCEEAIEGCIELCPDLIEGEWNINEDNGEACRELSCPPSGLLGDTNSQNKSDDITYTQCVPLTYGPYTFNPTTKTCNRPVIISTTEEVVSYEEKPATSVERYDEVSGSCVREYFCDGSEVSEDEEYGFVQFGNWQFDQSNVVCFREVTCFGETLTDQPDTKEPTYDWSYNNFTGNCEGVVLCDGSPVFGSQIVTQFPQSFGFWEYSTFSGKCIRTVNCAFGLDGEAEQEKEPTYQYSYDANTGWCSRQAICDGFAVAGAVETIFPSSFSQWNVQLAGTSCTRTVRCEHSSGSWIEQTVDATFTNGIDSPFCPGSKLFYLVCDGDVTNEYVCGVAKPGGKEDPKGKSLNSDVILLQEEVYPNPFRNEIVITLLPEKDIQVEIMLKDINMRTVRADEFELVKGLNRIHFNTGTVKPGAYSLLIINKTTGELLSTQKVIKQ